MTQEEILKKGVPIEPNCFETEREEQWYKVGLYEGATASPWHSIADGDLPKVNKQCLFRYEGNIYIGYRCITEDVFLEDVPSLSLNIKDFDYWVEVPDLPND